MRKLILLEINEVPIKVFQWYCEQYPESRLAKILSASTSIQTVSSDQGELHPWSTWPTLHRGVDNTVHGINDIGQELSYMDKKHPPIWQYIQDKGLSVGIFSSLHTFPLPANFKEYDFLVPDPFALGDTTHPKSVEAFQAFNLAMTKKSGRNVDKGIDKKKALRLGIALPGLGLRAKTIRKTLNQLRSERKDPDKTSRRRAFQAILAFDVYLKLLKKHKPDFTTFFSNHVASAMHRYWAATFPKDYPNNELPDSWIEKFKDEIPWCMHQFDEMLVDLEDFILSNPEYKLVIASSMGQEATKAELVKHELFLSDFQTFKSAFISYDLEQKSAMHPQYNFSAKKDADALEQVLNKSSINGEPFRFRRQGDFFSIDLGYPNVEEFHINLNGNETGLEDLGFLIKPIEDQSAGTAYHIPEGSLLIYDPQNKQDIPETLEIDLREVAPAILKNFEIDLPDYMMKSEFEI